MWGFIILRSKSRKIILSKHVANLAGALEGLCVVQQAQENVHWQTRLKEVTKLVTVSEKMRNVCSVTENVRGLLKN
jgi:hypothetical protein